jgi:hypothetical protein
MLIDRADYERCLKGFRITGCSIRSRDIFYFVAVERSHNRPRPEDDLITRIIPYFFTKPGKPWAYSSYEGYRRILAGASQHPKSQFIGIDRGGDVIVIGGGKMEEEHIPSGRNGPKRGGIRRVKTIRGFAYVSSGFRGIARRDGPNLWTSLCADIPVKPEPDSFGRYYGFEDFDAFDNGELYCVGGISDVWRFDGKQWKQIDFPGKGYRIPGSLACFGTRIPLQSVCCAGDGFVYIGGPDGAIWKGRDDHWQLINSANLSLPFKDMVWFHDRVYCTSDHSLWEIVGDEVRPCDVPEEILACSGNLAVGDGRMLLASESCAAYHDGTDWTLMFDTFRFS